MPAPRLPPRALSGVSFSIDHCLEDWLEIPLPSPELERAAHRAHPQPLRSHSIDDVHVKYQAHAERPSTAQSIYSRTPTDERSSYFNMAPVSTDQRSTRSHVVSPFTHCNAIPESSACSPATTPGLGDSAMATSASFPTVPVRPPLRPTVSFGGETRMSYYSYASRDMSQKADEVAEVEINQSRTTDNLDWRSYVTLASLSLLSLMSGLNVTSLAIALPAIATSFDLEALGAVWVVNSYLLAATLSQPMATRLSFAIDGKPLLLIGIAAVMGGSVLSALAASTWVLTLGRSIAGAGHGTLSVLCQLISQQLYAKRFRERPAIVMSLMFWLGTAAGPLAGGAISQALDWRYVFWLNVPICLLAFSGILLCLHMPLKQGSIVACLRKIDFIGWVLLVVCLCPLQLAISSAGSSYSWGSAQTLVLLVVSVAGLLFWTQYARYRIEPLLPISILHRATAVVSSLGTVVHGMIFTAIIYFLPDFLAADDGYDITRSGLVLGSWLFPLVLTASAASILLPRTGHRWLLWLGWLLTTLGSGLMALFAVDFSRILVVVIGVVCGAGLGLLVPSLYSALESAATTSDETMHSRPLHGFCSLLGQSLGLTVGCCVYLNRMQLQHLDGVERTGLASSSVAMQGELASSRAEALRVLWMVLCGLAGLAFVSSVWFTEGAQTQRNLVADESNIESHV